MEDDKKRKSLKREIEGKMRDRESEKKKMRRASGHWRRKEPSLIHRKPGKCRPTFFSFFFF